MPSVCRARPPIVGLSAKVEVSKLPRDVGDGGEGELVLGTGMQNSSALLGGIGGMLPLMLATSIVTLIPLMKAEDGEFALIS